MSERKKILLPNRYQGVENYLVPCPENVNKYYLEINDTVNALGVTMAPVSVEMDSYISSIDPSGGPFMELGHPLPGHEGNIVSCIVSGIDGYYIYLADTEEESREIFSRVIESTRTVTSGSGEYLTLSTETAEAPAIHKKIMIGMIGKAGSGKDTVADHIVGKYGFSKMAFADPLKKAVQTIFDVDDDYMFDREMRELPLPGWEPWTVRKLLQYVGTDLMRNQVDEDIWVKNAVSRIRRGTLVIISDVRFPNELHSVREMVGDEFETIFIKVSRPDHEDASGGIANHASESHIDALEADIDVVNDGTLEDLYAKVDVLMEGIIGG